MSAEIETLHVPFRAAMKTLGIPFTYHRPDRATGATPGDADFVLYWRGACLHIEFKDKETKVSKVQKDRHAELARAGVTVHILRELPAAIELARAWRDTVGELPPPEPLAIFEEPELRRIGHSIRRPDGNGGWTHVRLATERDAGVPGL